MRRELDFNDMLRTFDMMKKMGPMKDILNQIPGLAASLPENAFDKINDRETARIEAMILSMTPEERRNPDLITPSRRRRIAAGSGRQVKDVDALIYHYNQSKGFRD